jgi:hypothetical protein
MTKKTFANFKEFYPFYINEHKRKYTKLTHFIGTWLVILFTLRFIMTIDPMFLAYAIISGYGCAWFGHFFIEKNKPATFKYPFYSLIGDFVMFAEILKGKHKIL